MSTEFETTQQIQEEPRGNGSVPLRDSSCGIVVSEGASPVKADNAVSSTQTTETSTPPPVASVNADVAPTPSVVVNVDATPAATKQGQEIWMGITRRERHLLMFPLCCVMFLAALDQMIIIVCLPHIIKEFGHPELLAWVISAYMIACSAMTALYGRFSDVFGRRAVFLVSLGAFILGSILGGAANGAWMLIAARGVQGLGGGGLMTLSMVVIGDIAKPNLRAKYIGAVTLLFGVSSVLGPLIGGVFTDEVSWRWVFWINVPLGVIALVILFFFLRYKVTTKDMPLDILGSVLVFCATVCFVLFISWGGQEDGYPWDSDVIIGLIVACCVLALLFIAQEMRHPLPILNLKLFQSVTFSSLVGIMSFGAFSIFGTFSFLPLYFQTVYGDSAVVSGFRLLPQVAGIMVASIIGGRVLAKYAIWRPIMIFAAACLLAGCSMLTRIDQDPGYGYIAGSMALVGIGLGGLFPICTVVVQNSVPITDMANALSGLRFFQNLTGAAAVAIVGAVITSFQTTKFQETHNMSVALAYGMHWGFIINSGVAAVPLIIALTLRPVPSITVQKKVPKPTEVELQKQARR